ncbi:hypothetical protein HY572_04335 [Candidatus Micrarchaeota archaeon]|nr:hypothetical protein [Candidatus Micrarchaeota archaeon]
MHGIGKRPPTAMDQKKDAFFVEAMQVQTRVRRVLGQGDEFFGAEGGAPGTPKNFYDFIAFHYQK